MMTSNLLCCVIVMMVNSNRGSTIGLTGHRISFILKAEFVKRAKKKAGCGIRITSGGDI